MPRLSCDLFGFLQHMRSLQILYDTVTVRVGHGQPCRATMLQSAGHQYYHSMGLSNLGFWALYPGFAISAWQDGWCTTDDTMDESGI